MPEAEWLIEGVLPRQSSILMFGKSNSFKSFIAIDMGLSVAAGMDWHDADVAKGGVLLVATEGANGVGRLRVPTWYDYLDIPTGKRHVHLYPREILLDMDKDVSELIETMKAQGPFVLVVVDIFGGTMVGSEVDDRTARAWVHGIQRILRETGASVLTVAHTGWQDETRARMHTHFWGSFDTRLKVEGNKKDLTAVLSVERHKDADSTGTWGFRLTPSGASLVPVLDVDAAEPRKTMPPAQRNALDALHSAVKERGELKGDGWPPWPVTKIEHWREMCDHTKLSTSEQPEARRKAFQRARERLIQRGHIAIKDDYVWAVPATR